MAEVVLFHHVLGQTAGVMACADESQRAGHVVYALTRREPDFLATR